MNIHIGNIIRQELALKERGASWLARKINLHRTTVHAILNKESINTDLLLKISYALGKNLFEEYHKHLSQKFPPTKKS
ncbi:MAG: XRE family transcriptional regulator [Muribaculaceae bacterium]|nr:XRE family transcriptional regulator [Muribaculaceae bacterium]